jgi:hypothetical protein
VIKSGLRPRYSAPPNRAAPASAFFGFRFTHLAAGTTASSHRPPYRPCAGCLGLRLRTTVVVLVTLVARGDFTLGIFFQCFFAFVPVFYFFLHFFLKTHFLKNAFF